MLAIYLILTVSLLYLAFRILEAQYNDSVKSHHNSSNIYYRIVERNRNRKIKRG